MNVETSFFVDPDTVALIPTITLNWVNCENPECDAVHGIQINLVVFNLVFSLVFLNHE